PHKPREENRVPYDLHCFLLPTAVKRRPSPPSKSLQMLNSLRPKSPPEAGRFPRDRAEIWPPTPDISLAVGDLPVSAKTKPGICVRVETLCKPNRRVPSG